MRGEGNPMAKTHILAVTGAINPRNTACMAA